MLVRDDEMQVRADNAGSFADNNADLRGCQLQLFLAENRLESWPGLFHSFSYGGWRDDSNGSTGNSQPYDSARAWRAVVPISGDGKG